ncbi:MAG: hypothetical protein F6K49_31135 [Moorea sp. SIO3I6]|nr:hypothetical protein [Moorena sp. SIO3I6]
MGKLSKFYQLIINHVHLPTLQERSHFINITIIKQQNSRVGWANSDSLAIRSVIISICPPYFISVRTSSL